MKAWTLSLPFAVAAPTILGAPLRVARKEPLRMVSTRHPRSGAMGQLE
ncbi:hypothetical protein [Desulfobulbus sp.]|nr:hypothetical protein [Desulfobulbus sp.]